LIIKNLKVEEGFFNNLNLNFSNGLNVLVGGRGVGKTSIIELIRFGLGADNLSGSTSTESSSHALSILQSSGRVTIELEHNNKIITVSRSAFDSTPLATENYTSPIVFSQKEIETISLNKEGRLNLIDSFIPNTQEQQKKLSQLANLMHGLCAQYTNLKKELSELTDKSINLPSLKERELVLLQQQTEIQKKNSKIQENQNLLNNIQSRLASYSVDIQNLHSIKQIFEYRIQTLHSLLNQNQLPQLTSDIGQQLSKSIIEKLNIDHGFIQNSIQNNQATLLELNNSLNLITQQKAILEAEARKNRTEVESYTEGAGSILSELGRIREQIAQLNNYSNLAAQKQIQINTVYGQIQQNLETVAKQREENFQTRTAVINELNKNLLPIIATSITQQTNLTDYGLALENCLRGSGLKYKELINTIVERVNPQWLLYFSSTLKYQDFANTIGIPIDRATRLLAHISEVDLGEVLASSIEDSITFSLLDHGNYKSIEELSIGQRCTVALSIILENPNRVLVIDQPEDHLDNEFIAKTLIKSIRKRAEITQTIVSSHNANIPVLGNASNVVNLESNGRKGFIKVIGDIECIEVKNIIESIMEGGKEAFNHRSEFYKS